MRAGPGSDVARMRTAAYAIVAFAAVAGTACEEGRDASVARTTIASEAVEGSAPAVTAAPPGAASAGSPTPTDTPAAAVPQALDFTAPAVSGGQVVGAEFVGEAVALWFWAPW